MAIQQQRADARRNREAIVAAATELFASVGIDCQMGEIARRAGVGHGTVFRHFPAKKDLVVAVVGARMTWVLAQALEAVDPEDPGEALKTFLETVARIQIEDRGLKQMVSEHFHGDARLVENRDELLNLVASQGYGLVITVGFLYAPSTGAAGAKFPDVKFGDVDGFIDHTTCDTCQDESTTGNVTSLLFAENEGAYLVGAAAALKSQSHHIGFIGGVDIALIQKFQAGFDAGAQKIDPTIKIDHKYLTEPPNFAGFNDPAAAKTVAEGMYQSGADVVYHAAGGSGAGLFQAATEDSTQNNTHVWAIGTDSDPSL